jgi:hypothetical protein
MTVYWMTGALVAVAAALAHAAPAATTAAVYKCAGPDGVVYQDTACAPGTELRNFATDPPDLTIVPGASPPAPGSRGAPVAGRPPKTPGRDVMPVRGRAASNAAERRFIRVGMTAAEVVSRIGRPDMSARDKHGPGSRWSYLPRPEDAGTITTLIVVDGRVVDVERKLVH